MNRYISTLFEGMGVMDFTLNEEQQLVLERMREFCALYVDPIAVEIDQNSRFPVEVFEKLGEQGWMGMPFPVKYGGAGLDYLTYALVMEQLAQSSASVMLDLACHILASLGINNWGTEEQKEKYLKPLCQGKKMGAFAVTEPGAGTDMAAMSTTASLEGDEYVINGRKTFITNGPVADVFMMVAVSDKSKGSRGMSAFVVPKESPGFSVGTRYKKMGMKASQTSDLIFKDCRVPKENLIGEEGMGLKVALASLDHGRIIVAAQAVGIAQAALDECLAYTKQRIQFGKPIADNQAIQWMLADMAKDVSAARLLYCQAASFKDHGKPFTKETSIAKIFAAEAATRHTSMAVQMHGGYGYTQGVKVERLMRDAKITEIYEGTSEAQRMIVSGQLLR